MKYDATIAIKENIIAAAKTIDIILIVFLFISTPHYHYNRD